MSSDDQPPRRKWLNWTTAGTVAGVFLLVVMIAAITVGRDACAHKQFPFVCLWAQLFH